MRLFLIGSLLATTGLAMPALAAPPNTDPAPSFGEVIERAVDRYPDRPRTQARRRAAEALSDRAEGLMPDNPDLTARYQTDRIGSRDGLREWEAGLEMPLWRPGERGAARTEAEAVHAAARQFEHALRLRVAGEVREAVWQVTLRQNDVAMAKKEWETSQALADDVARRVELGELAQRDLMLARNEALAKRSAYRDAEAMLRQAEANYQELTGYERLPRRRGENRVPREQIPDGHPLLSAAHAEVRRSQARVRAVREAGGGSPSILIGGRGERATRQEDFVNSVGVSVTVPLGFFRYTRPAIAEAQLETTRAQTEREALHRRLRIRLEQAKEAVAATEERLALATEQNGIAQENLRLARIAFEVGELDLIDLLRVQQRAFAAERNERELKILRQRAIARYNQAAGVMP